MQFQTRLRSMIMRVMASETRRRWKHTTGRRLMRKKAGPCVHYFHEASDPYSHLAVQKLGDLRGSYDLPFQVHLVSSAKGDYRGDASRYDAWALRDAISVAAGYGVSFPASARLPSSAEVRTAQVKLARLLSAELVGSSDFSSTATRLGGELWRGKVKPEATETKLLEMNSEPHPLVLVGNTLRESLGHYAGGMFYFEGEWYWGLDRLYLLEQRLIDEGFGTGPVLVPRPVAQEPSAHGEPSASPQRAKRKPSAKRRIKSLQRAKRKSLQPVESPQPMESPQRTKRKSLQPKSPWNISRHSAAPTPPSALIEQWRSLTEQA